VAHLPGDPFRVFACSQPKGRSRMAGLVRASLAQSQMTQQRKPNPVVDVAVRKRRTFPRTEDKLTTALLPLTEN